MNEITLVGRSSSHYTRVARLFALELDVEHAFRPVLDITSLEVSDYAGNPALKIPILIDEEGPLFGTENVCRALIARSGRSNVLMRGDSTSRLVLNAEEMVLHVMTSEVTIVMAKMSGNASLAPPKVVRSIENSLTFLDEHVAEVEKALPTDRSLSFFEVSLFSVMRHLVFREVLDVSPWERLAEFCERFETRPSAQATTFRFDAAPLNPA